MRMCRERGDRRDRLTSDCHSHADLQKQHILPSLYWEKHVEQDDVILFRSSVPVNFAIESDIQIM